MFNGIVILAPLSLPITVMVVVKAVKLDPNKVLIVVPVIVNEVPTWLVDNIEKYCLGGEWNKNSGLGRS